MKSEPNLWEFSKVELDIPHTKRVKALKIYHKIGYNTQEEVALLTALDWLAEQAENRILHIRSIIRKAQFKNPSNLK